MHDFLILSHLIFPKGSTYLKTDEAGFPVGLPGYPLTTWRDGEQEDTSAPRKLCFKATRQEPHTMSVTSVTELCLL